MTTPVEELTRNHCTTCNVIVTAWESVYERVEEEYFTFEVYVLDSLRQETRQEFAVPASRAAAMMAALIQKPSVVAVSGRVRA